jgi:hypothetical protein
MDQGAESEPFLGDFSVVFHQVFTLIDPAMNTSEIKPLHLALPKKHGMPRPAAAQPAVEKPRAEEQQNAPRTLTQRYSAPRRTKAHPLDTPNSIAQTTHRLAARVDDAAHQAVTQSPSPKPPAPEPRSAEASPVQSGDFWLFPIHPQSPARFDFRVDASQTPWHFTLHPEGDQSLVLSAQMNGSARAAGLRISIPKNSNPVAEGRLDRSTSAFFCVANLDADRGEACSVIMSGDRLGEFIMPAIRKVEGKSRMCLIAVSEMSGLYQKLLQNAKEAIRLRTREPPGGDLTFEGRFERAAPGNFLLFHDSNTKRDLCQLGLTARGSYLLEICYPLSMLQGFFAAICAAMPS